MVLWHPRGDLCRGYHRHHVEGFRVPAFLRGGVSDKNRRGPRALSDRGADAKPADSIKSAGCVSALSDFLYRTALLYGVMVASQRILTAHRPASACTCSRNGCILG